MSKLVDEFKKEQEAIRELLLKLERLGVHTMEGRNQLLEGKEKILFHLNRQVNELYPELEKASEIDPDLKPILEKFRNEMKEISDFCVNFFDKYSVGGGGIEFLRDFELLQSTIESRIAEETTIIETNEGD